MHMPHSLQLALGYSSFGLIVNVVSTIIYIPGIVYLTPRFGIVTPAALWVLINALNILPMAMFTHHHVLRGEAWTWFVGSVARPVFVTSAIVAASWWLAPQKISWLITAPWLVGTALLSSLAIIFSSWQTRSFARTVLRRQTHVLHN
jgi:O-antigen/teichoic acid export membrane protein